MEPCILDLGTLDIGTWNPGTLEPWNPGTLEPFVEVNREDLMTRPVLPTPATPSYCAAMTVGTMVKRFAHVRFLVDCLWVQPLFTLSVPRDIFRTPALTWGRFIDSGNQVGRTRSDIQAAGPRRCQSQIVLLLLGCKAGLISLYLNTYIYTFNIYIYI